MRARLGLVLALSLSGCSDGSRSDPDVLPLAPDGVAVVPGTLHTTRVRITWNDLSDNEAAFIIQTSADGIVWTNGEAVGFNVTTADVTGLVPDVPVFIRVASDNAKGTVPSAASITVTPPLPVWTPLGTGPGFLYWTCSAFDPTRRLMLVFGGRDELLNQANTLHALNLNGAPPTWSTITPAIGNTPPAARYGSSLIYDPLLDRLILFGGKVGLAAVAELWEFRLSTSQWFPLATTGIPPTAREHHSAVYDSDRKRMVIYGGENAGTYAPEVFSLTLPAVGTPAWSTFPITGTAPTPRSRHAAIYDGDARRMIVFAGVDNDNADGSTSARDAWSLDLSAVLPSAWTSLLVSGGPPSFRDGHAAVWDSFNGQMVVYGGGDDSSVPNDEVWTLTLPLTGTCVWRPWTLAPTAGPRFYGAAVFDPVGVRMFIFGGAVDDTLLPTDDTWSLGL